ncbi:MAG: hypothetical protein AB8F74_02960 [Saprospiraceae bacterium]
MKNALTSILLLLNFIATAQVQFPLYGDKESFDIKFEIEKTDKEEYFLVASIELSEDSYVVSPFSKDDTYGHFIISIAENKYLTKGTELLEIPPSTEEYDPILEEPVHFVRVNTTYKQKLKLNSTNDFKVSGLLEFLLEPACIPYDVEFLISSSSGVLEVEKVRTFISKEYKVNK